MEHYKTAGSIAWRRSCRCTSSARATDCLVGRRFTCLSGFRSLFFCEPPATISSVLQGIVSAFGHSAFFRFFQLFSGFESRLVSSVPELVPISDVRFRCSILCGVVSFVWSRPGRTTDVDGQVLLGGCWKGSLGLLSRLGRGLDVHRTVNTGFYARKERGVLSYRGWNVRAGGFGCRLERATHPRSACRGCRRLGADASRRPRIKCWSRFLRARCC